MDLRDVSLTYGENPVLSSVSLRVEAGEVFGLIGPSGSGKTRLLRLVVGLEAPTSGEVTIGGRPADTVEPWRNRVGMVFQGEALYEHVDVAGNLAFPRLMRGDGRRQAGRAAERQAGWLGLRGLLRRRPRALSGGERGLVAAARALMADEVEVLALDEPLSRADQYMRERFRAELRRIHQRTGVTVLLATNDQQEAMAVCDRVAVLLEGRARQQGTPAELRHHPSHLEVARFVHAPALNLIPAQVVPVDQGWGLAVGEDRLAVAADLQRWEGRRVVVGIAPEEWHPAPPDAPFRQCLHVTVSRVDDLGRLGYLQVGLGSAAAPAYMVEVTPPVPLRPGDKLELQWPAARLRLFDPDSGEALFTG